MAKFKKAEYDVSTIIGRQTVKGWTIGKIGIHKHEKIYMVDHLSSGMSITYVNSYKKARAVAEIISLDIDELPDLEFYDSTCQVDGTSAKEYQSRYKTDETMKVIVALAESANTANLSVI